MEPKEPAFSAYDADEEPWRIARLIRTDGRVRELFRVATPDSADSPSSVGEHVWSEHVSRLHDERGTLQAHVSATLANSAWLAVIALVLSRAWNGEDEAEVEFLVEGEPLPWPLSAVLPKL
jgi:hypothetical protein